MDQGWKMYFRAKALPFWAIHAVAIAGVVTLGFSWAGLGIAVASYFIRMFFVTTGYHRYFSHRTFKTSRIGQFLFAFLAQTSAQKGALWWASHHRWHHKRSDEIDDVHSVKQHGFMWAHVGWILSEKWADTDMKRVGDLARYPELVWLNKWNGLLPAVVFAVVCQLIGGWYLLSWAFFISTVLLWHGTFTINSLAHVFGRRRYQTTDDSRNSLVLALITLGEGWHNNHHHYQSSANQGFFWWEIDVSYYVLRALAAVGLVWDVRRAPVSALESPGYSPSEPARSAPSHPST